MKKEERECGGIKLIPMYLSKKQKPKKENNKEKGNTKDTKEKK